MIAPAKLLILGVALVALAPSPMARAAEPIEGSWARSARECRDRESPNSGTLIDLTGKVGPLFDQYEHHCRITRRDRVGQTQTLRLTCHEFWDDFEKRRDPSQQTVVLRQGSNADVLIIDKKRFQRCSR